MFTLRSDVCGPEAHLCSVCQVSASTGDFCTMFSLVGAKAS